jgi:hypothetical protein
MQWTLVSRRASSMQPSRHLSGRSAFPDEVDAARRSSSHSVLDALASTLELHFDKALIPVTGLLSVY